MIKQEMKNITKIDSRWDQYKSNSLNLLKSEEKEKKENVKKQKVSQSAWNVKIIYATVLVQWPRRQYYLSVLFILIITNKNWSSGRESSDKTGVTDTKGQSFKLIWQSWYKNEPAANELLLNRRDLLNRQQKDSGITKIKQEKGSKRSHSPYIRWKKFRGREEIGILLNV